VSNTVLAPLGTGLARGESPRESCEFALMTAAEQVSQIGIAPMLNAALPRPAILNVVLGEKELAELL